MDFDDWLEEYREDKNRGDADWYPNNVQIFESGAASRQAEIDALREMVKNLIDNTVLSIDDELEDKANNLLEGNKK